MKRLVAYLTILALSLIVVGADSNRYSLEHKLLQRGLPNAPDGYAPKRGRCPSDRPAIRNAETLAPQEASWLKTRRPKAIESLGELLDRLDITGFDAKSYLNKHKNDLADLPNIAIATSGGGYRALMNGAGNLAAFDSRTENSTSPGGVGGLLQSATYLAGLSGACWLVGSIYSDNFTSVQSIINGKEGSTWDFANSIFEGPSGDIQFLSSAEYYHTLIDQVVNKENAGFPVSVTDFWGRALAFQLIHAKSGGPSYTWSSIADNNFIKHGTAPLPICVADERDPGMLVIPTTTTVFEFTPWEMGSWDPTVFGFAPMQYVGSKFEAGKLPNSSSCVEGYDSASFIMGTSSTLFNEFALEFGNQFGLPTFLNNFIQKLLNTVSRSQNIIATWVNPFYQWNPQSNPNAQSTDLFLVDGGEDLENIPLQPLIQPVRNIDVIVAIDSSDDTVYTWPAGLSLIATYERSLNTSLSNGTAFPSIPDSATFVNLGLNTRPTFFGCQSDNTSNPHVQNTTPPPLIVYIPNAPYTTFSNVSTFDPSYSDDERNAIIQNGYNVATRGNASTETWPECLGCALLKRSLERTKTKIPATCQKCYAEYCWDGTLNSTHHAPYDPKPYDVSVQGANTKLNAATTRGRNLDNITRFTVLSSFILAALISIC